VSRVEYWELSIVSAKMGHGFRRFVREGGSCLVVGGLRFKWNALYLQLNL
jgi:hypothetical protein